jgi:hypothetical protein
VPVKVRFVVLVKIQEFFMLFFRKCIMVGLLVGGLPMLALAGANDARVQPLSPSAGRASVYEVRFTLTEAFPSTGSVILMFPDGFDLSQTVLAGSPNVKGGFRVFVDGRRVRVQRSGLGKPIPAGRPIILRVANIRNPKSAGTYRLSFKVLAGKRVLGEVNSVSFSVLPSKRPLKPIR